MKQLTTIVFFIFYLSANAQDKLNIVPKPAEIKSGFSKITLSNRVSIICYNIYGDEARRVGKYLSVELKKRYNVFCSITDLAEKGRPSGYPIYITTTETKKNGEYKISIGRNSASINGDSIGIFYGVQTLLQLIEKQNNKLFIPQLSITDYPRFAYRGMHLDVARHFMPVDFVKKYIDYLAAYKFNTFHWHLTDDQGWRIEIKKYPLLTQVGGWRNGTIIGRYPGTGNTNTKHGGFYTQEQVKEIVKYAADRYITVIPEIEMPGHASAAIAAYPQLSCFPDEDTKIQPDCIWSGAAKGKMVQQTWGVFEDVFAPTDYTFNFLQDVLDEVMPLFPSKYIHIGGDECPKENWKRSEFCQQLIKQNNLKDEHGLQSYFINRIEKYINSKGKNIIGWDEILEGGLAPNATVMSWRGEEGGIEAAKQNHDVIMTPGSHCYIDHSQSKNDDSVTIGGYLPLEKVYSYEPVPSVLNTEQAKHILGAQGNLWSEYISNAAKVEYMIFPRMLALSEVLWSPKEKRDWNDFERRLPVLFERLDRQRINYSKAYYDLKATVMPMENNEGVIWAFDELKDKKSLQRIFIQKRFSVDPKIDLPVYDAEGNLSKRKVTDSSVSIFTPLPANKKIVIENSSTLNAKLLRGATPFGFEVLYDEKNPISILSQKFLFNKATGKKITSVNEPSKNYPGDGAFTLVNGVQNEKGLSKSNEFLGFNGKDLDVTIDLGAVTEVKKVTLHTLGQTGSWIYLPTSVEVQYIVAQDSGTNTRMPPIQFQTKQVTPQNGNVKVELAGTYECRYIRVIAKNVGVIPAGNPGAGEKAWLFADEIEVE